jgi:hypothetical protein
MNLPQIKNKMCFFYSFLWLFLLYFDVKRHNGGWALSEGLAFVVFMVFAFWDPFVSAKERALDEYLDKMVSNYIKREGDKVLSEAQPQVDKVEEVVKTAEVEVNQVVKAVETDVTQVVDTVKKV